MAEFAIVDGRRAQIVVRPPVLPRTLDLLLRALRVVRSRQLVLRGTGIDCRDDRHLFAEWLRGLYGLRELLLKQCTNCGTVEVRDVSHDALPGAPAGRQAPRRGDELLGWYSGRRPAGRIYT